MNMMELRFTVKGNFYFSVLVQNSGTDTQLKITNYQYNND